jgi:RNA polymerase sigma-70 factor (ECF subfamily)
MEQAGPASPLLALTAGLARGDDEAWSQFHRDYGPGVFRHLLAATRGDHDLASEALQQTYLRIARHARPCESEPMFAAWIRIVARTALSDCRRRRVSFWQMLSRRREDPSGDVSGGVSTPEDDRLQSALDAALATLDPAERDLLDAKYFSGADVRTIAERLGISLKAAESRLTRARAELRRHLLAALARHD